MKERIRKHTISFRNAFGGLFYAFKSQPNFQIHFLLSFIALLGGFLLEISYIEMLIIVLMIIVGLITEMLNTAIESITDLITSEWKQEAKIAKDVSAGMMLLTAVGACIIAGIIFLPRIIPLFYKV
jgi:diacylglycerol kinase